MGPKLLSAPSYTLIEPRGTWFFILITRTSLSRELVIIVYLCFFKTKNNNNTSFPGLHREMETRMEPFMRSGRGGGELMIRS